MMSAAVVLEARDLGYQTAAGTPIVEHVDLQLRAGEIIAIAGPNGAGKSTLLRLLAGLLVPSSGDIRVLGSPISSLSSRQRAQQIAFVGQREEPDGRLTTADYVALGRIPHQAEAPRNTHERAIAQALEATGLRERRTARLTTLSGGEMQRAVIARALCQEPSILFLDEPTNHLDPRAKGSILSLVAQLGVATVCVLHDLPLIPQLAEQTLILEDASVAFCGPTQDALNASVVKRVFGVDILQFSHPTSGHPVTALDIPITRSDSISKE